MPHARINRILSLVETATLEIGKWNQVNAVERRPKSKLSRGVCILFGGHVLSYHNRLRDPQFNDLRGPIAKDVTICKRRGTGVVDASLDDLISDIPQTDVQVDSIKENSLKASLLSVLSAR